IILPLATRDPPDCSTLHPLPGGRPWTQNYVVHPTSVKAGLLTVRRVRWHGFLLASAVLLLAGACAADPPAAGRQPDYGGPSLAGPEVAGPGPNAGAALLSNNGLGLPLRT
ncbi:MAG: hypothetical protein ACYDCQ_15360, partial [Dehalococcoidia bacterium]